MAEVTPPRSLSEEDRREHFDCGRESMNVWFRRHAWHNHASGISRVTVICSATTGLVAGYVTLSAAQIEREFLANAHRRNRPDRLPATLLGQLAVDNRYQGRGHALTLMQFALTAALRASREVGSFGIITHPIDEQVREFYGRWGFQDVPFDPKRSMIARMIDIERSGFVA